MLPHTVSVFDLVLGSAAGMVKGDMLGNATTLKGKLAAGQSLQELVDSELAGKELKKLVGDGKTATCAFLWLTRCATPPLFALLRKNIFLNIATGH